MKFKNSKNKKKKKFKFCIFNRKNETSINYLNFQLLDTFLNEKGKIKPKFLFNICTKHFRKIARNIKISRQLYLLPFFKK